MSIEALVLLVLFVVLPLIRQMRQAMRQQNQSAPEPAGRQSPATLARTPPPGALAVPPQLPATLHAGSAAIPASGRMPAPDAGGPVTLALTPHRTLGRGATVGLRDRRELRRAIVLATILGPCRASNPYDWPERAGHS